MTANLPLQTLGAWLALVAFCSAVNFKVPATLHHAVKHSNVTSKNTCRQSLINALGFYLIGAIEVGSPAQPLLVDFDLTTTLTYLFDGEVLGQQCGLCFNKSHSHTYKDLRKDCKPPGFSGHWSSDVYKVAGYQLRQKFPLINHCTDCDPLLTMQRVAIARYAGKG
ncbi:hypothetical protein AAVH_31466 [Aphelenchoides avenae]|nr:hypothetical protein AAVH_31466 [Aphelenchus avenae]